MVEKWFLMFSHHVEFLDSRPKATHVILLLHRDREGRHAIEDNE